MTLVLLVARLIPIERPPAITTDTPEVSAVVLLDGYDPLRHQFLPIFLGFQTSHRHIVLLRDHREEFNGKFRETRVLACVTHSLGNPLALLRCNVRGRKDPLCRIDQEEDEDLPVTRFRGILQLEWLDPVLVQVRECDASVGFGDHITDILHTRASPDTRDPQFTGLEGRRSWETHIFIS